MALKKAYLRLPRFAAALHRAAVTACALLGASAYAQTEIILDNITPVFSTTGTWPASTSVSGYIGTNYQAKQQSAPPGAIVVDNTDAGFSVTGTWPSSTAVSGYLGTNYQHHYANGEPPSAVVSDNSSGSATGTWPTSTSVSGYIGTNYQVHAAGTGSNVFTWTPNAPNTGTYEVYARWTQHPNRATNAKYTVSHAGGSDVVTVNQEQGGGSWNLLGTYIFDAGASTVSLSDEANGYVIADAVMLVPPNAPPSTATWTLPVPSAGNYNVYARWTAHPNRATDAKYTINHAGGSNTVTANQEQNSGAWNLLGSYSFNAGTATVSLTDQANGYVIADAIMLLPPNSPPNTATWTPNVAQAGQYEVYARWTQNANRATDAKYTVTHAGGSTTTTVNQQANGGIWNLLGTYSLAPGTSHNIALTDEANGYVVADAIRLVPVTVQAEAKLYFIHTDHLNTPRQVYDENQQLRWKWDQQEPFGASPPDENPAALGAFEFNLRFPGQYADKETGSHYNNARDYDAALGRYVESDPIGLSGGMNTYAYGASSPLRQADSTGLFLDLIGTGGIQAGFHALAGGLNVTCGYVVSIGASCQACRYCTVCSRVGPGVYVGGGVTFGGGIAGGDVNNFAGDSFGGGFDVGAGVSTIGASVGVGVSGNVFTGPIGTPVSVAAARGRYGLGWGVSAGIELCRTKILACDVQLWGGKP